VATKIPELGNGRVTVIHFVPKDTSIVTTPAVNRRMIE
jgi:hypothetical protein